MTKPFLILQLRPEDEVSNDEFAAIIRHGGLDVTETHRIRMESSPIPSINLDKYSAVIIGGGPYNLSDEEKPAEQKRFEKELKPLFAEIIARDFPYLGSCSGLTLLASNLGGTIAKGRYSEGVGACNVHLTEDGKKDPLLEGLPSVFRSFGGHKESCQEVPDGATLLATSEKCLVQLLRVKNNIYGYQYHTELDSAGLEVRIIFYKHKGYFPPEDADMLIAEGHSETVTYPMVILKRFVERYRRQ